MVVKVTGTWETLLKLMHTAYLLTPACTLRVTGQQGQCTPLGQRQHQPGRCQKQLPTVMWSTKAEEQVVNAF
jgi:hypothetical protein